MAASICAWNIVDPDTAEIIHSIIKEEFAGYTVIAITHMLKSFLYFDAAAFIREDLS